MSSSKSVVRLSNSTLTEEEEKVCDSLTLLHIPNSPAPPPWPSLLLCPPHNPTLVVSAPSTRHKISTVGPTHHWIPSPALTPLQQRHSIVTYGCKFCPYLSFNRPKDFKRHQLRVHPPYGTNLEHNLFSSFYPGNPTRPFMKIKCTLCQQTFRYTQYILHLECSEEYHGIFFRPTPAQQEFLDDTIFNMRAPSLWWYDIIISNPKRVPFSKLFMDNYTTHPSQLPHRVYTITRPSSSSQ